MTRKAPPPRPRGLEWPDYITPDGTLMTVVQRSQRPKTAEDEWLEPTVDPGPNLTVGEQLLREFIKSVSPNFNYVDTDDGDLRQYWCPHCGEITAAVTWHCEVCGESFNAGDIDDQVDKPPVEIPYGVAHSLRSAFHEILHGADSRDALALKAGRRRTSIPQYFLQKYAAFLVRKYMEPIGDLSMTAACNRVAGELSDRIGNKETRTIENWYKKFYPPEK